MFMLKKRQILLISLFLAAATLIAFWQVTDSDFIRYDDGEYVTQNPHIQHGLTMEGIRWAFTTLYVGNWHPLTWISHMLDVELFGFKPHWHHVTNLLFHIANTLLLFLVLRRMTKATWQSAVVAALFALHPLHVESVAWVAERKDVLSTFFWMLTLGAYVFYVERPGLQRYLAVILFFALGLIAKPMLVTLPFVLLLLDYWPLERFRPKESSGEIRSANHPASAERRKEKTRKKRSAIGALAAQKPAARPNPWAGIRPLLWEKIPFFVLTALSCLVTFLAQQQAGAVRSIEVFPPGVRVANAFVSYVAYIGKMFWPANLAVLYPHPGMWPLGQALGAVFLLIAVTALVVRSATRFPYFAVGWFWYLGTLVPVIGFVQVGSQAMADRYTYIPLIGLFIMAAWGIPKLLKKWRYRNEALLALSLLILLCLFMVTRTQVGYWKDSLTLFDHTLNVTDRNSTIYYNRGVVYNELGNPARAIGDYNRAIETNPRYADAYYNRGLAYISLDNFRQAIGDFDRAIEINPRFADAYNNRGAAYKDMGNLTRAMGDFDRAIVIDPENAKAYYNRAMINGSLGNHRQAFEDFKLAARYGYEDARIFLRSKGINW
jgi:hypothetical protein